MAGEQATSPPQSLSSPQSLNSRSSSRRSHPSTRSNRTQAPHVSEETTPLLSRRESDEGPRYLQSANAQPGSPATQSLRSVQDGQRGKTKGGYRWASIAAFACLTLVIITILGLGFAAPAIVEEYAQQAAVFEPTSISVDSLTTTGVRVRVQGTFTLDASRVHKKSVADIGRTAAWIAKEIETRGSDVKVYVPEYSNTLLGVGLVPAIKVNIRNNHVNSIDFLTDLEPGDIDGIRQVANDWLQGRLGSFSLRGVATVQLKSGILNLGTHRISDSMLFEGHDLPSLPEFDIDALRFDEVGPPGKPEGMAAMASVSVMNRFPLEFDIPPLSFDVLVPNCLPNQENLLLGDAKTDIARVRPKQYFSVNVTGLIRELPTKLTTACPMSDSSPLDAILASYLQGKDTTVYVRGGDRQESETPGWMTNLLGGTIFPLPLPGHPFDNLIRNFSLADVHFTLPDPWAEPDTPESYPKVSANVKALVALPKDMNFNIDVDRVKADADVFYKGQKLGELDLHRWQTATTSKLEDGNSSGLLVQSKVDEAPLKIIDNDAFAHLVQTLVFGGKGAILGIKAELDVNTNTALGEFVIRKIPAEGKIHVKPILRGGLSNFKPQIGSLEILETSKTSLKIQAKANITNPTEFSAQIPYFNISILKNGTVLGSVIAENLHIVPGRNLDLVTTGLWNPSVASGTRGSEIGRNFISQYISGFNTTLTLKTHENTIPSLPALGKAISDLEVVIDTPQLSPPQPPGGGGDDGKLDPKPGGPHFIRDATFHLLSSTACFDLFSPLPRTTLYITSIDAVAFYNHTIPIGIMSHYLPFAVPPGRSTTPRMPVMWDISNAGYDAVRDALGGSLKLDARANASVKIGHWEEDLWFVGSGIGAHVKL